jgi:hypothetical protein
MLQTALARIPESGSFGDIAQDLNYCRNVCSDALAAPREPVGEVSGNAWDEGILYRDLEPGAPLYAAPKEPT